MQNYRDGHRLEAEPTESLTTLLGLGQKSLVNGSEGFFFQIRYLLPAIYFVAPVRALSLSSWRFISHRAYINNPPHVSLFFRRLAREPRRIFPRRERDPLSIAWFIFAREFRTGLSCECKTFLLTRFTALLESSTFPEIF